MDEPSKHVIRCKTPGLTCCEHQLVSKVPADNVRRVEVWCGRWRENRMKDKVFRFCDAEYAVKS